MASDPGSNSDEEAPEPIPIADDAASAAPVPTSLGLSTALIVQVEVPALGLKTHLSIGIVPSRSRHVGDAVVDLLRTLAEDYEADLESIDLEGSQFQVELVQRKALKQLEGWKAEIKEAEEWKMKMDRMREQMKKMSDMHFKELLHLREQVYQKRKAEKENKPFTASYATYFDPSDYLADDEVTERIKDKVALLQQEFDHKSAIVEVKYRGRVDSLNQQLMAAKMKEERKDKLLRKMMKKHKYEDEDHIESELGVVKVSAEKVQDSIDRKMDKAEGKAEKSILKEQKAHSSQHENTSADLTPVLQFHGFLERKFGSLKQATSELYAKYGATKDMGFFDFQAVLNELGYTCDEKVLFSKVSNGRPISTLQKMLEPPRRKSDSAPEGCQLKGFAGISGKLAEKLLGRRQSTPGKLGGIEEESGETELERGANRDCMASDMDDGGLSDGSDTSKASKSSLGSRSSKSSISSARTTKSLVKKAGQTVTGVVGVARAAAKFKAKVNGKAGRKKTDQETMTDLTHGTRVDCGTDAKPYYAAFPKKSLCTRACQSKIDGTMLDKAMDFFDEQAQDDWNDVMAGLDFDPPGYTDSESDDEADEFSAVANQKSGAVTMGDLPRLEKVGLLGTAYPFPGRCLPHAQVELDKKEVDKQSPFNPSITNTCTDFGVIDWRGRFAGGDKVVIQRDLVGHFSLSQPSASGQMARRTSSKSKGEGQVLRNQSIQTRSVQIQVGGALPRQDAGVQASATPTDMLAPFEHWFPSDDDPHELQLEQVLEMTKEIHNRLPELRWRAEKLAAEAKPGSSGEQEVTELLERLHMAPPAHLSAEVAPHAPTTRAPAVPATAALQELLSRHGVSTRMDLSTSPPPDIDSGRNTHSGITSTSQRRKAFANGRPSQKAGIIHQKPSLTDQQLRSTELPILGVETSLDTSAVPPDRATLRRRSDTGLLARPSDAMSRTPADGPSDNQQHVVAEIDFVARQSFDSVLMSQRSRLTGREETDDDIPRDSLSSVFGLDDETCQGEEIAFDPGEEVAFDPQPSGSRSKSHTIPRTTPVSHVMSESPEMSGDDGSTSAPLSRLDRQGNSNILDMDSCPKAETARPMKLVDGTKVIAQRAKRSAGLVALSNKVQPSPSDQPPSDQPPLATASLVPGWSGLSPRQTFVPLGVSVQREDTLEGTPEQEGTEETGARHTAPRVELALDEPASALFSRRAMPRPGTKGSPRPGTQGSASDVRYTDASHGSVRPGTQCSPRKQPPQQSSHGLSHPSRQATPRVRPGSKGNVSNGGRLSSKSGRLTCDSEYNSAESINSATDREHTFTTINGEDASGEEFDVLSEWPSSKDRKRAAHTPRGLTTASPAKKTPIDLPTVGSALMKPSDRLTSGSSAGVQPSDRLTSGSAASSSSVMGARSAINALPETAIIASPDPKPGTPMQAIRRGKPFIKALNHISQRPIAIAREMLSIGKGCKDKPLAHTSQPDGMPSRQVSEGSCYDSQDGGVRLAALPITRQISEGSSTVRTTMRHGQVRKPGRLATMVTDKSRQNPYDSDGDDVQLPITRQISEGSPTVQTTIPGPCRFQQTSE